MVKTFKKILFIVTQSEFGGAQRYIFDLATNLDQERYSVIIAAGSPACPDLSGQAGGELFLRLANIPNIRIHHLRYLKRAINPILDLLALFELKNLIKREEPDVIHLNSTKAGVLGSLVALNPKRYTLIYTVHGWVFNEPLPWWLKKFYLWCEKLTAKFKNKIICVSEFDRQIALKYKIAPASTRGESTRGGSAEKIVTIHNGIDLKKLEFLPKEEARRKIFENQKFFADRVIGTIANFYPTKGLKYLIEVISSLNAKPSTLNAKFLIIGEGPERKKIELQIASYKLQDEVFLTGAIPDAYKYLKAFDAFILSSVKEGFPYAVLEAMAAGLPIVATNAGGIPEIIEDGVNGFLVPTKNPLLLSEKIIELLKNPELAKKFGDNNLEKIKEFNLENMIEKTEEQYK